MINYTDSEFFERRIITGMIVSTDFLQRIEKFWRPALLESSELAMLGSWCFDYFKQYGKAPNNDIGSIYIDHLKNGRLSKTDGQYIEELLANLSNEYERDAQFNSAYLYDKTVRHFKARELEQHNQEVQALVDAGRVEEAETLASSYRPIILEDKDIGLDLSSEEALRRVERAFSVATNPIISYPGALGRMWNSQLTRGAFFTLLGSEKRGKTWWLLELALRAARQKANVAFFEAGDMTEDQILRRVCIYVSQRSDKKEYCGERFRSVGDCLYNQLDTCERPDRNCDFGIFGGNVEGDSTSLPLEFLVRRYNELPDYEPCDSYDCPSRRGVVWLRKLPKVSPLTARQAAQSLQKFFQKYHRRFKLVTYPAGLLTVTEIRKCLDDWERHDGFVPDAIVIDYADLLSADDSKISEFRHRQDHVWKSLRGLSQERHALVISATQADAASYTKRQLTMSNFSEDKRKLAHVTAQYGLNQDSSGREKRLSIMRINAIVVREGDFVSDDEVTVLYDRSVGRAFLESYV